LRRPARVDATSHAARTLATIAGHCSQESQSAVKSIAARYQLPAAGAVGAGHKHVPERA